MQAQLEFRKLPSFLVILVALVTSLVLGGALGYTLRTSTTISGPSRVVVVSSLPSSGNPADDACVFVNHHKAC